MEKNVPKLRFPEFNGEWEEKKLSEVSEKIQDGTHFSPQILDIGDYLYITSKNVKNGYIELSNAQYISKDAHESIYKRCDVKKGDILLTKDGTIGQTCVNELDIKFSLLSSVAFIRPNIYNSNYFIYQVLVSPIGQKEIESQIAGQALKRITLSKINNFVYSFPSLPEQTKIASFLTAVDDKLSSLKKKKQLLEQYKKGVMQQIFSQQLRFKDDNGEDFGEWEEKQISEICEVVVGGTPSTTKKEYWGGSISWIGSGEIKDSTIYKPTKHITDLGLSKSSTKLLSVGTTVLAMTGATLGKVGFTQIECCGNQSVAGFVKLKNTYSRFLFYKLLSEKNQILSFAGGAAQAGINKSNIESLQVTIPSYEEQTKIANFLSAIDEKISHFGTQIEKMEGWKKGLLQGMFV